MLTKSNFYALMGIFTLLVLTGTAAAIGDTSTASSIDLTSYTALAASIQKMAETQGSGSTIVYVMSLLTTIFGVAFYRTQLSKDSQVKDFQTDMGKMADNNNRRVDDLVRSLNETNKNMALLVQNLHDRPCIKE